MFHLVFESHDGRALGAESEEKREPASDIDTGAVDGLKVLDPDGRLEKRTSGFGLGGLAVLVRRLAPALIGHDTRPKRESSAIKARRGGGRRKKIGVLELVDRIARETQAGFYWLDRQHPLCIPSKPWLLALEEFGYFLQLSLLLVRIHAAFSLGPYLNF